ncbi:protein mono-ADP-ribosyltransferase PARP10, partial [Biomphalaria glabrata]
GEKIHRLNGNLLWDNQLITFDVIGPTQLVFVRTYGTMNNTPEIELKSLFTQRNASYNCAVIKKLDAYCYCISFQKDWDAVLEVCELSWKYHDQHLSLFPYFESFSASVEYQYDSLLKKSKKGCKPTIYDSKQESASRNTSFPSVERKQSIEFKEKFSGYSNVTNDTFKEIMPSKSYLEKFTIVFAHPFLPKLLFLLNIHKEVEKHNCYITNECTDSLDFEIQGDKIFFKKLNQLFNKEFEKLRDSPNRNDFLGLEKVQPYLKMVILFLKAFVTLTFNNDLLFIDVSTNENKYSFEDFVRSLVQTNKYSLPSNQDLKNEEWESFVQHFNEKNTCIHIFQSKLVVQIVFLSHFSECLKDSLDVIDNKINDIFVLIRPTDITSQKDCVGATSGIKFFDQSTQAKPQKDMRNVSKVYIMKYPFIAKILSALSVEKAVQEKYPFLTLEVCDQAIKISGLKHDVEECLDVLHHQEEMITLQQSKPNFLEDNYSQLKVLTLIQSSEHSISFENTLPKTELYVLVEPDHKTKLLFKDYLTSLLISTDNFQLPDNDFENNNKWKKFKTDFRNQYPFCQIIVTDGSQVFLFFMQNTYDEKRVHLLKNIVGKTISSMLENCTSNIAASEHSENINKCTLKRTTDFDLSILEKHLICHDINKTEVRKEKSAMITTKKYEAATNVTKFHWMYENETAAELNVRKTFQQIEQNISNLIEAAYIQDYGELDLDINSGPYGQVDFSKMTIVFNEQARRLIRTEKFSDLPDQIVLSDTWQNMNLDVWRLFEVGPTEKEFSALLNALETDLNSETNKVEILKVQRLQNINLFKHYKMKSSLMQKPIHSIFLWQRIALDTQELVCQHGFHPIFCAIHDAEDLGSGNLFFEKAGRCLHTRDFVDNTTVCLLYSEVLVGKSGQGKRSMRLPPFDKEANVIYDSVKLDDAYLVFSDVQAYPSYFVMIKMIKND